MTIQQLTSSHPDPRFFEPGTALDRFLSEAPYIARCSDDKTATRLKPRHIAIKYPYIQANRENFVSWLIFDLDHQNPYSWQDMGLPAPNLIVQTRKTGQSHLYYAITPVCTSESARIKPINYMRAIYEAYASKLQADPNFHSGPVAKTPGHKWWTTQELHSHVYELGELADYVDLPTYSFKPRPNIDDVSHSRHCLLFEQLRHFAYAMVGNYRSAGYECFFNAILLHAERLNSFEKFGFTQNLAYSSIKSTAKSVARWTFHKYRGSRRCNVGSMALSSDIPLKDKQKLSAERTAAIRREKSLDAVLQAARTLIRDGQKLTQAAIGKAANLSRQTVAKFWQAVEKIKDAPLSAQEKPNVKLGLHQVTAAQPQAELFEIEGVLPGQHSQVFEKVAFFKRE